MLIVFRLPRFGEFSVLVFGVRDQFLLFLKQSVLKNYLLEDEFYAAIFAMQTARLDASLNEKLPLSVCNIN